MPFFLYTLSLWILLIILSDGQSWLSVILIIIHTYINLNIGAKRVRDTGGKGAYFIYLSLGIYLFCIINIAIKGADCDTPGVQINVAWVLLTTVMLSIIPPANKKNNF